MVRVVPINLAYNPRTLWFDPQDLEIHKDDPVIVETARGTEFARAADEIMEVDDSAIKSFKSSLKPIKKIADKDDVARADKLEKRGREALGVFREIVENSKIEMRPISVEFLFDGDKAIFYFEAEERVDFRELVRKLASRFHVRVDMRQIGVRDEARLIGGIGHCGQELCCKRMGGNFNTVSIRMAKEQDLSLNPQSISGLCGRLMCCLRFEYDAYKEFKSRAPKVNAQIETPEGSVKVVGLDVPREIVCMQDDEGKKVYVPLCDFEPAEDGKRPCAVGDSAWEQATADVVSGYSSDNASLSTLKVSDDPIFDDNKDATKTKKRNRKKQSAQSHTEEFSEPDDNDVSAREDTRRKRRRRSTKITSGSNSENSSEKTVRVGQKSSGLSRNNDNDRPRSARGSDAEGNTHKQNVRVQSSKNRNKGNNPQGKKKNKSSKNTSGNLKRGGQNKQTDQHQPRRSRTVNTSADKESTKNEKPQDRTSQKGNK